MKARVFVSITQNTSCLLAVASRSTEATVSEEFDILPFQLYRGFLPFGSVESARW